MRRIIPIALAGILAAAPIQANDLSIFHPDTLDQRAVEEFQFSSPFKMPLGASEDYRNLAEMWYNPVLYAPGTIFETYLPEPEYPDSIKQAAVRDTLFLTGYADFVLARKQKKIPRAEIDTVRNSLLLPEINFRIHNENSEELREKYGPAVRTAISNAIKKCYATSPHDAVIVEWPFEFGINTVLREQNQ